MEVELERHTLRLMRQVQTAVLEQWRAVADISPWNHVLGILLLSLTAQRFLKDRFTAGNPALSPQTNRSRRILAPCLMKGTAAASIGF